VGRQLAGGHSRLFQYRRRGLKHPVSPPMARCH